MLEAAYASDAGGYTLLRAATHAIDMVTYLPWSAPSSLMLTRPPALK